MELIIVDDIDELSHTIAAEILRLATERSQSAKPFTIALSGGSTPKNLHALMAGDPEIKDRLPWQTIHLFWGDERHVPPEDPQSNYRMARETLIDRTPLPPENIHRMKGELPEAVRAAEEYEQELKKYFNHKSGELPQFDCVLLGMGPDGHTASLFPGTGALHVKNRLVVANWVAKFQSFRITLTAPVVNNANLIIFMVSGEQKADALKEVLEGKYRPELYPAQLIHPTHGRLLWVVDQAAAGALTESIKV
jgi:6-phosphogluconolactonase